MMGIWKEARAEEKKRMVMSGSYGYRGTAKETKVTSKTRVKPGIGVEGVENLELNYDLKRSLESINIGWMVLVGDD